MPDCSAVTVTAYLPEELRPQAEAILAELGDITSDAGWDWKPGKGDGETNIADDKAWIQWSDYDCPWGTTTPAEAGLFKRLREMGIAYQAVDFGHYTWDGSTEVWTPEMGDDPVLISSGVEGTWHIPAVTLMQIADEQDDAETFKATVLSLIPPILGERIDDSVEGSD